MVDLANDALVLLQVLGCERCSSLLFQRADLGLHCCLVDPHNMLVMMGVDAKVLAQGFQKFVLVHLCIAGDLAGFLGEACSWD